VYCLDSDSGDLGLPGAKTGLRRSLSGLRGAERLCWLAGVRGWLDGLRGSTMAGPRRGSLEGLPALP